MNQWPLLRRVLGALGLTAEQVDDLIATIQGWLGDGKGDSAENEKEPLPYHLRDGLLSSAELSFYHVLKQATPDYQALAKVNLGDLFMPKHPDHAKWRMYRNKIDRKHVDFLLCDPKTLQPLLGIELDDKSHQRKDRQQRDRFVDRVFAVAGLPLLHVRAAYSYSVGEVAAQVEQSLNGAVSPADELIEKSVEPEKKLCPRCSAEMQLRIARRGPNAGNQFWGCTNYPKCRETQPA